MMHRRFSFTLAHHLGMTVEQLHRTMPAGEYFQWQEVLLGKERQPEPLEQMIAQLTAITVNINSKSKTQPVDFLVSLDEDTRKNTQHNAMAQSLMSDLDKL